MDIDLKLQFPHNTSEVLDRIHQVGGKWDKFNKVWRVNINWLPYLLSVLPDGMKQQYSVKLLDYENKIKNQNILVNEIISETGFKAFEYQISAVNFVLNNGSSLLNISLGGGKTFVSLSLINKKLIEKKDARILILCPSYLKKQVWENEIKKFYPSMDYEVIEYDKETRKMAYIKPYPRVKIVSLETARQDGDADVLKRMVWDFIIIDEASKIKNKSTKINKLVSRLMAYSKIALTGYPIENGIEDLYGIFKFVDGSLFRNWEMFKTNFLKMREIYLHKNKTLIEVVDGYKNLEVLFEVMKPYIFRTDRSVVDRYLPKLYNRDILLELSGKQKLAYDTLVELIFSDKSKLFENIHQIKQLLNFLSHLSQDHEQSVKYEEVLNILNELQKGRVMIFTYYIETANKIKEYLEKDAKIWKSEVITGQVSYEDRDKILNESKNHDRFILVTTDALSMGFNLQHFDTIINFDLPWNPAKLENRIGRVYRQGQTQNVRVYNLICQNTFEERIINILKNKLNLIDRLSKVESGVPDWELINVIFGKGDLNE